MHALGPAVVRRQGDGGDDVLLVQAQAAGEGVQVRQVAGPRGPGPVLELGLVGVVWAAKERTRAARLVICGQAAVSGLSSGRRLSLRASGLVSRSRAACLGDRCGRSVSTRP